MPVIFVTAEEAWNSPAPTRPLSERWPAVGPDPSGVFHLVSALLSTSGGEPVLIVSTDEASHRCAATIVAAICSPEVGHIRLSGSGTAMWMNSCAITMIPDGYLGLAGALVRRLDQLSRTYAAVSSVVSLNAPVPGVGDVLRSVLLPGSRFWVDVASKSISTLREAKVGEASAAVIAHCARRWDAPLESLRLPQSRVDLGRIASGDELWNCRQWVEVTLVAQAPGALVHEMLAISERRCRGCHARTAGMACTFCGQTSPAGELSEVRQ